jgi:hypothetical protein
MRRSTVIAAIDDRSSVVQVLGRPKIVDHMAFDQPRHLMVGQ